MATPAAKINLQERLKELDAEIAELRTSAGNHAKELETIESLRMVCPPEEIAKLMIRKDVVATLLDRTNVTLAERDAAYDSLSRQIRANEKEYADAEPFRKIATLVQQIEQDLAPMRGALDPRNWNRIQQNLFELRSMQVLNIQTTPRVNTMSGDISGEPMQAAHAPLAREEASKLVAALTPLYSALTGILGR